jgi:hypothetical protein
LNLVLIKDIKGRELIERVALMRSIVRIAKRLRKSLWMHVCPVPWGGT